MQVPARSDPVAPCGPNPIFDQTSRSSPFTQTPVFPHKNLDIFHKMKHIPNFLSTPTKNFDTCVLNTKLYLNHFKDTSPEDEKDALLFLIEGYARLILEQAISSGIDNDFSTSKRF